MSCASHTFCIKTSGTAKEVDIIRLVLILCLFLPTVAYTAPAFKIYDKGTETIINYESYGDFIYIGTERYAYHIRDSIGLSRAAGEGIYPNEQSVLNSPDYQQLFSLGKLKGNHWDFANSYDLQSVFYKWATCQEEPGVKQFTIAQILEKAGHIEHAIKAYYAVVVHFPKSVGYTFWGTPWYPGPVAIDKIYYLTRKYPKVGMELVGARIRIGNKFDDDVTNDVFIIHPGKLVKCPSRDLVPKRADLSGMKIIKKVGGDKVELVQFENRHWQLRVNGKPYLVKGISYSPTKVGLSPDNGTVVTHKDWMFDDYNYDGIVDSPYQSWVDMNNNNRPDFEDRACGDFQLLQEMGANTIRLYHHGYNKQLLRDGYEEFGLMYLMGDFLGMYAVGSGANWGYGTDYTNEEDKKSMLESVIEMVLEYRDEPYILMWVLGNENNYGRGQDEIYQGQGCRAYEQPEAYYKFVNEVAKMIKELDPYGRPVAICNGDLLYLDKFTRYCPDVDVFGTNSYRGAHGFGYSFWKEVSEECDKPVLITEYGCPAYMDGKTLEEAEEAQAEYHRGCWEDIYYDSAGYGIGNAIGGVVFSFVDEWWKAGPPYLSAPAVHDTKAYDFKTKKYLQGNSAGPFPDGWMYEEWLGLCGQGDGALSPFLRHLRKAYYMYKDLWNRSL